MSIGIRRSLWMMAGEVVGVALVASLAVLGVAELLLRWPIAFDAIKLLGSLYLFWIGIQLWRSRGKLALGQAATQNISATELIAQGFITACANPKAWAFNIAILPPFIDFERPIHWQLLILLLVIVCSEFICMLIYASGGRSLRHLLERDNGSQWLNRISASLMILVAVWLLCS
jgi:threonine/homoserine/homoserine lactone efflux protein